MTCLRPLLFSLSFAAVASLSRPAEKPTNAVDLQLTLQSLIHPFKTGDGWTQVHFRHSVASEHAAIIICDMWDRHWCGGATTRVEALAHRMAPVLEQARAKSILIIHAPSDTMAFYAHAPGRLLAEQAPHATPPSGIEPTEKEPPLPIDDRDGGCDTPGDQEHQAWTRETPLLKIESGDVISDKGTEIYNVLRQHHVNTVLMMGVHANMCILNRSFGIRQLTRWGVHCILVRDLTDAMYNPASWPHVSHSAGTNLVIEHIEKYWAPTVASDDLIRQLSTGS
ncbi:MAG TPA: isochorismatase family protein [Bryobacteraceae bacterium]|jgi:nicotinamidase-related amidase|nr:isochorismatase family protein [Bryobacteraceae bacterium]